MSTDKIIDGPGARALRNKMHAPLRHGDTISSREGDLLEALSEATISVEHWHALAEQCYLWAYAPQTRLAQYRLAIANAEADEGEWPAGQEWSGLGVTSQTTFRRQAREEARVPHEAFLLPIRTAVFGVTDICEDADGWPTPTLPVRKPPAHDLCAHTLKCAQPGGECTCGASEFIELKRRLAEVEAERDALQRDVADHQLLLLGIHNRLKYHGENCNDDCTYIRRTVIGHIGDRHRGAAKILAATEDKS